MEMMSSFHKSFKKLEWTVKSVTEIRPGVAEFDFVFNGIDKDGNEVEKPGTEYVIVFEGILQHVEVRNKQK